MAPSMFFVMARPAWTSAYRDLDFLNPSGSGDVSFRGPKSNSLVRSTCPGHHGVVPCVGAPTHSLPAAGRMRR